MIDREKVINGLEECAGNGNCTKCQYGKEKQALSCKKLLADALSLLKEQEAVEPICQIIFDVPYYFCGNCKTMLNMYAIKAKYCSNCAREVKWV